MDHEHDRPERPLRPDRDEHRKKPVKPRERGDGERTHGDRQGAGGETIVKLFVNEYGKDSREFRFGDGSVLVGRDPKADIVLVDTSHPAMKPVRDPLRSLIYTAAERAVRDVFVDGVKVVGDGQMLTLDQWAAGEKLEEAQKRAAKGVPALHHAKWTAEQVSPLSLPVGD